MLFYLSFFRPQFSFSIFCDGQRGRYENAFMYVRVWEAGAEAVGCGSRFQIGGWDSYIMAEAEAEAAEAALKSTTSKPLMYVLPSFYVRRTGFHFWSVVRLVC